MLKDNSYFFNQDISIGVAFNPYLPSYLFDEEILRLEKKLQSGLVSSIWIQFGTDYKLLKSRIEILSRMISATILKNPKISKISLFGSILIPSKQFISRFKFRPWKGVYIADKYLNCLDDFYEFTKDLVEIYLDNNIFPVIETECTSKEKLEEIYTLIKT